MIQPIKTLTKLLKEWVPNIIAHADAVQAIGKVPIDVQDLGIDSLSLSGHKFGAPKGIGIFYLKKGIKCNLLIEGGGQEEGLRSGIENVPYIMGVAKSLEIINHNLSEKLISLSKFDDKFFKALKEIP